MVVSINGGTPVNRWSVYFLENPIYRWGPPISGTSICVWLQNAPNERRGGPQIYV